MSINLACGESATFRDMRFRVVERTFDVTCALARGHVGDHEAREGGEHYNDAVSWPQIEERICRVLAGIGQ